jgi:hypothetical protein
MFKPIVVFHWSWSQHGIVPTQARIWLCTAPPLSPCLASCATRPEASPLVINVSQNSTSSAAITRTRLRLEANFREVGGEVGAWTSPVLASAAHALVVRGRSSLCDDEASDLLSLKFIGRCASACPGLRSCPAGRSTHPACESQAATDKQKVCVALAQR